MKTVLRALGTANPPRYVTQEEAFAVYRAHFDLGPAEERLYERVLINGQIRGRYVAIDDDAEVCEASPDRLVERFRVHGCRIACEAARRAMDSAGLAAAQIGGLVVNTCTGYLCPGLSSYVAETLGLDQAIKVADLMGMGCGAAIPNLETAAGLVARGLGRPVLSIAVEICTATLFMGPKPDLVISNCIFGDGAAAAVVDEGGDGSAAGLARLIDFESALLPSHRDDLRYHTEQGRLRNTLSAAVPEIGATAIAGVTRRLLDRHGLADSDIGWWVVHPGGVAVLDRVAEALRLPKEALRFSYGIFRDYGNMSSPSVLFVLQRLLQEGRPRPGQRGLLLSFGAGFTAFAALIEF